MDIIVRGINEKNTQVFKEFFEENFASLVMFADKYLDDMEAASDIAQECFIRLWKVEQTFKSKEKVKGYLYVMAKNLSLNELRHRAVVNRHAQEGMLKSEEYFKDNLLEEEVYSIIYKAIDELAPRSRQIILLSLQKFSNREIAEKMDISINTMRTLKQNAYKKLRGLLKDYSHLFLLD